LVFEGPPKKPYFVFFQNRWEKKKKSQKSRPGLGGKGAEWGGGKKLLPLFEAGAYFGEAEGRGG